jgi:hypothetical protein
MGRFLVQAPSSAGAESVFVSANSNLPSMSQMSTGVPSNGDPVGQAVPGSQMLERSRPPPPPSSIAGRRNLRNWTSRPAPTDFETWAQAEHALQSGVTVKQLVEREMTRSLGPDQVRFFPYRQGMGFLSSVRECHMSLARVVLDVVHHDVRCTHHACTGHHHCAMRLLVAVQIMILTVQVIASALQSVRPRYMCAGTCQW